MSRISFSLALVCCMAAGAVAAEENPNSASLQTQAARQSPSEETPEKMPARGGEPGGVLAAQEPWWMADPSADEPAKRLRARSPARGPAEKPAVKPFKPAVPPPRLIEQPVRRLSSPPRAERSPVRRKRLVLRLNNAPAEDVADTINRLLREERQGMADDPGTVPVVLADAVTNSLLLSAAPEQMEEILRLAEALDRRPPQVLVRMLIAEFAQFEVEGDAAARKPTAGAGGKENAPVLGLPANSNFSGDELRRELQLGVLSPAASQQDLQTKIRKLEKSKRLKVLSRPQFLVLDSQPASLQVGRREPIIRGAAMSRGGQINQVDYENVGIQVGLTARVNPEGPVTMEIDIEISRVSSPEDGVAVSVMESGKIIRAPRVVTSTAQTTVTIDEGQTVVLSGLASESNSRREELLILATPEIVSP